MKVILNNSALVFASKSISQFTKNAIAASGNTFTTEQQSALDTFFNAIGAGEVDSIMSKINVMLLPFLASGNEKVLMNYANGINTVSSTIDTSKYALESAKGLKQIAASGTMAFADNYSLDAKNLCAFFSMYGFSLSSIGANSTNYLFEVVNDASTFDLGCYALKNGAGFSSNLNVNTISKALSFNADTDTTYPFGTFTKDGVVETGRSGVQTLYSGKIRSGAFNISGLVDISQTDIDGGWTSLSGTLKLMCNSMTYYTPIYTGIILGGGLTKAEAETLITAFGGLKSAFNLI